MRIYGHSPARAGEVMLEDAIVARRQLNKRNRAAIRASGIHGDALFEALTAETARIRNLTYKEITAELIAGKETKKDE